MYIAQRRRLNRRMEAQVSALYGRRLSMRSLFSGAEPLTEDVPTSGFSVPPPAFVPGSVSGAATIATKSSGEPSLADIFLSPPSPTGHAHIDSNTRTVPRDAPSSNTRSAARNGNNGLTDEVVGLRAEMENLRRAMQEIHIQVGRGTEAPPEYVE